MKVWTIPHTLFDAKNLVSQLNKHGIPSQLVDEIGNDDEIYILYGALAAPKIPKNYIVYQTEIAGSHFFNERYLDIIKNALAVLEYSEHNLSAYSHEHKIFLQPAVYPQPVVKKDIPVLFYGWIQGSTRREIILDKIRQHCDLKVVVNIMGQAMWDILSRTKVVINLHYYDNSPLEVFRLAEAASHNCAVVSERGYPYDYNAIAEEMIPRIDGALARQFEPFSDFKFRVQDFKFSQVVERLNVILGKKIDINQ